MPKQGELVEHQKYDEYYKTSISNLALARGYLDGKFQISRLEISPETHEAWWRMLFDSGVVSLWQHHLQPFPNSRRLSAKYAQYQIGRSLVSDLSELTNNFSPPTGLAPYSYNLTFAKKIN